MTKIQPLQSIMIMLCKMKFVLILPMGSYIIYIYIYPALSLIDQLNCIVWILFVIYGQ